MPTAHAGKKTREVHFAHRCSHTYTCHWASVGGRHVCVHQGDLRHILVIKLHILSLPFTALIQISKKEEVINIYEQKDREKKNKLLLEINFECIFVN